jgi:hypothetical protein
MELIPYNQHRQPSPRIRPVDPLEGWLIVVELFPKNVKHADIRWNPATGEWFCARCGRTSNHLLEPDAKSELEQYDCELGSRSSHNRGRVPDW